MRYFLIILIGSFILSTATSCRARAVRTTPKAKTVYVNYKIVRVNGKRYYKWNGKTYRKTRKGYIILR